MPARNRLRHPELFLLDDNNALEEICKHCFNRKICKHARYVLYATLEPNYHSSGLRCLFTSRVAVSVLPSPDISKNIAEAEGYFINR